MAIAAVDAEAGDVMLMAERNRLRLANPRISDIGRALNFHGHPTEGGHHEDRAKNRGARHGIGAAMKNLRHAGLRSSKATNQTLADSPICGSVMVTAQQKPTTERFAPA